MIVLLIVAVVCMPFVAWHLVAKAKDKQLEAEVNLDMYQTLYKQFTRDSVRATNELVCQIVDRVFNFTTFAQEKDKRDLIKTLILRDIGHLKHLNSTFFALLGAPDEKEEPK